MFDIGYSELLLVGIVALLVIGPKDLPRVMRTVGQWMGRARGMARHFRSGIDAMVRDAEIEEMNKQWAAHNAAIMAAHPSLDDERAADADDIFERGGNSPLSGSPETAQPGAPQSASPVADAGIPPAGRGEFGDKA